MFSIMFFSWNIVTTILWLDLPRKKLQVQLRTVPSANPGLSNVPGKAPSVHPNGFGWVISQFDYVPFKSPFQPQQVVCKQNTQVYTVCRCFSFDLRTFWMRKYRVDNITLFTGVPTSGVVLVIRMNDRWFPNKLAARTHELFPIPAEQAYADSGDWFFPHPTTASKKFLKDHKASWNIRIKWWWLKYAENQ